MAETKYDVLGIGNAIFDVLVQTDEGFLARHGMTKGGMALIDEARALAIYGDMGKDSGTPVEMSGGAAANTIVGIASLGARTAFIGKVKDDQIGRLYSHDIKAANVAFATSPAASGPATGCSYILVTPDGQRTMGTYLGACVELGPEDIDPAVIAAARITYLEGYLFDQPRAKEAFRKASSLAHAAGRKVALSLSDPFCVDRHRADFRALVSGEIDILFANEAEICSLYETQDFATAAAAVSGHVEIAALTRSEEGSVIIAGDTRYQVFPSPVGRIVDTTGAGDLYAAGVLFGLTRGLPLPTCGTIGSLCAAEIISHMGARPESRLDQIVAPALSDTRHF